MKDEAEETGDDLPEERELQAAPPVPARAAEELDPVDEEVDDTLLREPENGDATLLRGGAPEPAAADGPDAPEPGAEDLDATVLRDAAGEPAEPTLLTPGATVEVPVPAVPAAAAACPLIPDVTITDVLGAGGQGTVYRGTQSFLDRVVAVKVLDSSASSSFEARFRREAKILATMTHPHIVTCHQAGVTEDGNCFMIMEFIDGPDLAKWIRENGALDCRHALVVARDIAVALDHAHAASVIHRDVKPQNVLLQRVAQGDPVFPFRAKLADLGLARSTSADSTQANLTMQGTVMGTPSTMALEQFDDPDSVDFRADVYGLGCVLFHALAGRPAFRVTSLSAVIRAKSRGAPPELEELSEATEGTRGLLARMLSADREDRPQSYAELIAELEREIGRLDPVRIAATEEASRPGARPLPRAAGSRRPLVLGGSAAVVAVLGWFLWPGSAAEPPAPGEVAERAGPTPAETTDPAREPEPPGSDEGDSERGPAAVRRPAVERAAALAPGEEQELFADWEEATLLEGWERSETYAWFGDIDDFTVPSARAGAGKTVSATSPPLPAGLWQLEGSFQLDTGYKLDPDEARGGVRLRLPSGAALELAARLVDGDRVRVAWSSVAADDSPAPVVEGAEPLDAARGTWIQFRVRRVPEGLELRLSTTDVVDASCALVDDEAPHELELFLREGTAKWSDFVLVGRR